MRGFEEIWGERTARERAEIVRRWSLSDELGARKREHEATGFRMGVAASEAATHCANTT